MRRDFALDCERNKEDNNFYVKTFEHTRVLESFFLSLSIYITRRKSKWQVHFPRLRTLWMWCRAVQGGSEVKLPAPDMKANARECELSPLAVHSIREDGFQSLQQFEPQLGPMISLFYPCCENVCPVSLRLAKQYTLRDFHTRSHFSSSSHNPTIFELDFVSLSVGWRVECLMRYFNWSTATSHRPRPIF